MQLTAPHQNHGDAAAETWQALKCGLMISSKGRLRKSNGEELHGRTEGRELVSVHVDGRMRKLAEVVAENFNVPRESGCDYICYRDGNPSNCDRENISWCKTPFTLSRSVRCRHLSDPTRSDWMTFPNATVAGRQLGIHMSKISACCRGVQKQTKGWVFEWTSEVLAAKSAMEKTVRGLMKFEAEELILTLPPGEIDDLITSVSSGSQRAIA